MNDINLFQKAIEQLVLEGFSILQIVEPTGQTLFFNVYKWQEGYYNSVQSIDFNTVEGVNITDFLSKNAALFTNRTNFTTLFNKVLTDGVVIRCQFSKDSIWYKWSAV